MTLAIDQTALPRRFETHALGALFVLSGAAALSHQVLWVRELGLLLWRLAARLQRQLW